MLAKLTRGNQITIPKEIVRRAGLREGEEYLDVTYEAGAIRLRPVEIEDRVPPEIYDKLLDRAFKEERGDIMVRDKGADSVLSKRSKKR